MNKLFFAFSLLSVTMTSLTQASLQKKIKNASNKISEIRTNIKTGNTQNVSPDCSKCCGNFCNKD